MPKIKISNNDIKYIIQQYQNNISVLDLAYKYNVDQSTIRRILNKNNIKLNGVPGQRRIFEVNDCFFDEIDTAEKAYLLGFLFADGYIYNKNNSITLGLAEQDVDTLQLLNNLIQPTKKLYYHSYKNKNQQDRYSMIIRSKHMREKLAEYGVVQCKTHITKFPHMINDNFYNSFILGVFDGDGCVGLYPKKDSNRWICSTYIIGTYEFILFVKNIIETNIGVHCSLIKIDCNGDIYRIQISGYKQVLKMMNYMYSNSSTIFLQRKYKKFIEINEKYIQYLELKESKEAI
jgi:intein-encoded DNA endonuclease-like protein